MGIHLKFISSFNFRSICLMLDTVGAGRVLNAYLDLVIGWNSRLELRRL